MDLDEMNLPEVNEQKEKSEFHQRLLKIELVKTVEKFEKENNYKFMSYEVDNILLEIVKRNHESYLNKKFGFRS